MSRGVPAAAVDGASADHVLLINGVRIAARSTGSGDPVLLLNGFSRPLQSWAGFGELLPHRQVITFDVPGVGASQTPLLPYSMQMLADVAVQVLDAFGVAGADVVGFSFGGAVAQQVAISFPDRVNRLVLMATSCGLASVPGLGRDLTRIMLRPNAGTRWPAPGLVGLLWQLGAISTWTSVASLSRISAPTLVVCGTGDRAVPPANSKLLAARIPNARMVTVPGGHDLQKPGPAEAVAELIEEFLDSRELLAG